MKKFPRTQSVHSARSHARSVGTREITKTKKIIKGSKDQSLSATHAPDIEAIVLTVVGDAAIAEVHAPRVARMVRVRGRRPIEGRNTVRKPALIYRRPWVRNTVIHNAHQLFLGRQPPAAASQRKRAADALCAGVVSGIVGAGRLVPVVNRRRAAARAVVVLPHAALLPDQGGVVIGNRAVAIVCERHLVDVVRPVLPGAGAGDLGVGGYILVTFGLPCVGEFEGVSCRGNCKW